MKRRATFAFLVAAGLSSCGRPAEPAREQPPNVLWIVWDTVRADHLSLYGYERETTPFLDEWARGARVFEDCIAPGIATVPSHASMFTGLAVSEHGSNNGNTTLARSLDTAAEVLRDAGYQTYLWSANPHISEASGFTQGFDTEQHPWDDAFLERARGIVRDKLPTADRERLQSRIERLNKVEWAVKASGTLAREALAAWLERTDPERPYFAFLNYMEAHRELVPAEEYRARFLTPEQVARSYEIDTSWKRTWSFTFALEEYSQEELEIIAGVYDAALAELDDLLRDLLGSLERSGHLDDTVVILTADHGEHLGEHHLLEHQYSLYQPLIGVPLVVHHPRLFAAGRDSVPTMNFDVFPTLLELAGATPRDANALSVSLLAPRAGRARMAEYPVPFPPALNEVQRKHPELDTSAWSAQWAYLDPPWKLVWRPGGSPELYDLAGDPAERSDQAPQRGKRVSRMADELRELLSRAKARAVPPDPAPKLSRREQKILGALGYTEGADEGEPDEGEDP